MLQIIVDGINITIPNADNHLVADVRKAVQAWERREYDGDTLFVCKTAVNPFDGAKRLQHIMMNKDMKAYKDASNLSVKQIGR